MIHNDVVKANAFNDYFSSVFNDEDISNLQELQRSSTLQPFLLGFVNVSARVVFELLSDLNPNKACGPDLIPARLLRDRRALKILCLGFLNCPCVLVLYRKTGYLLSTCAQEK